MVLSGVVMEPTKTLISLLALGSVVVNFEEVFW